MATYIDVFVTNPYADQKKYDAEFKAHGLNIKLQLVAASPSLADTVVYFGSSSNFTGIKIITAKAGAHTGGGGSNCPIGFRVRANFRGTAELGSAARPSPASNMKRPLRRSRPAKRCTACISSVTGSAPCSRS